MKPHSPQTKEMKYKLIYLEWEDALRTNSEWLWDDELDFGVEEIPMKHISVGFLIKETKNAIHLSQSINPMKQADGSHSISRPFLIPVSAIRKRKVLKI